MLLEILLVNNFCPGGSPERDLVLLTKIAINSEVKAIAQAGVSGLHTRLGGKTPAGKKEFNCYTISP